MTTNKEIRMSARDDIDRLKVMQEMFPTSGPHRPKDVIAAAEAIGELWRYLAHAMGSRAAASDVIADLADAYTMVGALADADRKASNVLTRLSHWATYVGDRSVYTDYYGISDPDGSPDQIQSLMNRVTKRFRAAAAAHATSAEELDRAHRQLSFVYTNSDDQD